MKIATWNVNSIRHLEQIVDWLRQNSVDVLSAETKVVDANFRDPLRTGYHLYLSGQKAQWRCLIGSPLEEVSTGFLDTK